METPHLAKKDWIMDQYVYDYIAKKYHLKFTLFLTSNCFCCSVTWFLRNGRYNFLQSTFAVLLHHDLKKICSIHLHSNFFVKTTYASKHGLVMLHLSDLVPLPLSCNYQEYQDVLQWHHYHKHQYQNLLVNY